MAAKVFWLASYPRSGNTWLRVLLAQAIYGRVSDSEQVAQMVPNIHFGINGQHLMQRTAIIVKTHWPYEEGLPLRSETAGAIYIVRHPVDVMASALRYRFMTASATESAASPDELRRRARRWARLYLANRGAPHWLRSGFGHWDEHVESWTQGHRTIPVHVVRYEDLRARTEAALLGACDFLGAEITPVRLAAALQNSGMAFMRQLEQREIESGARHLFHGSGTPTATLPQLRFTDSADSDEGRALALTEDERQAARMLFADTMRKFDYA